MAAPGCGGSCNLDHRKRRRRGVESQEPSLAASSTGVHGKCACCYEPLRFGVAGCHRETDMHGEYDEGSHKGNVSCPSGEKYKFMAVIVKEKVGVDNTQMYTHGYTQTHTPYIHTCLCIHTHK